MSPVRTLADFERDFDAAIRRRDFAGATAAATSCHRAWPDAVQGWLFVSVLALQQTDPSGALAIIDECLSQHPDDAECLLQRAQCLRALGRRSEMLEAIRAAADGAGEDARILEAIGDLLFGIGEFEAGAGVLDRAVKVAPDSMALLSKRSEFLRSLGRLEAAERDYETVLQRVPGAPGVLLRLVELRRQTRQSNRLLTLEKALMAVRPCSREAAILHFALAKSYEDLDEHLRSWHHLTLGNRFERARIQYDPCVNQVLVERIIGTFPEVEGVWQDTTLERPIFIVGLPRTGTTLVERIISAHSEVHPAGELTAFSAAVVMAIRRRPSGRVASRFEVSSPVEPALIARGYLANAQLIRGEKPRFCDKHPLNFFHCALILRAFPKARIVHLTRHPLGTCHAIYKSRFAMGALDCAYDLDDLGSFYVGYRKLMSHWHRVLPGRILDVAYEDVVTALEPTTRRLLEYLELPFEEACLVPHKNPAASTTASAVQVRQPVYDSSLQRWRHYAEQLAPLRAKFELAGIKVE